MREHDRLPELRQDPRLFELVKAQVLRPFCIRGIRQEVGVEVMLERHVAHGLQTVGKVLLVG